MTLVIATKASFRPQGDVYKNPFQLYRGSVTDECDPRVCGTDFVSCIELIEHINEDEHCYFTKTIFESLKPRYAVITTPNREFNQHWPNLRWVI